MGKQKEEKNEIQKVVGIILAILFTIIIVQYFAGTIVTVVVLITAGYIYYNIYTKKNKAKHKRNEQRLKPLSKTYRIPMREILEDLNFTNEEVCDVYVNTKDDVLVVVEK